MPVALIAAFRTCLALFVLSIYTIIVAPPVLIWTALSRDLRLIYAAGHLPLRLSLALAGIRVKVTGAEHVQRDRPAVYAANHNSNIDPPVVFDALSPLHTRLKIIYKAELRKLPLLVWIFDIAGFVAVERANRGQSLPALARATQSLLDGDSFLIFPEGTRSRTGELLPFKKGGFVMAIRAQVPIVPVIVSGGRDAMRRGSRIMWPATITVEFAPPIPTTGLTPEDRNEVIAKVRGAMTDRIARMNRSPVEARQAVGQKPQ